MAEFITPNFLQNCSTDEFHKKMKNILPADIDMSEGGHVWNLTRPTALIAAELCEFILPEVIKLVFPEHSYGEYLDSHAKARNLKRREATYAEGDITIAGIAGTFIPTGSIFSTASINNSQSVDYEAMEEAVITESGTITVPIKCTQPGVIGNTARGTIIFNSNGITGITSITNEFAISGGIEEEEDGPLIERILEYDRTLDANFVGSISDYKRWALSVEGVGSATVIPAQDDTGIVTIIITDSDGYAAGEQLCWAVQDYIMRYDNPEERLAPVNAVVQVVPPYIAQIIVKATVELTEGYMIEQVRKSFISQLTQYLAVAMEEKEIKYTKVCSVLSKTDGVNDFSNLQIGIVDGSPLGTINISIEDSVLPVVYEKDVTFTAGTV